MVEAGALMWVPRSERNCICRVRRRLLVVMEGDENTLRRETDVDEKQEERETTV